jgi:hypothetical protein
VRKARIHRGLKKVDVVLTSARYAGGGSRLAQARGFERRGDVWSDTLLYDRETLVGRLRAGQRIVVGREASLPGDYEVGQSVDLMDGEWIVVGGGDGGRDDLGVPLY